MLGGIKRIGHWQVVGGSMLMTSLQARASTEQKQSGMQNMNMRILALLAAMVCLPAHAASEVDAFDAGNGSRPFDLSLELQGIVFHVTDESVDGGRAMRIAPQGLEIDNSAMTHPLNGDIARAEVADLDRDGSPEIYVFVRSPGRGLPGELVAYAANRKKSLSAIYLPPVSEDPEIAEGYRGEDEFAVVENTLVQRFALYDSADASAGRTGKMREIQYRLMPGEAGWILQRQKVMEY